METKEKRFRDSWTSTSFCDHPSHMPVPSVVFLLFMVHLKELLTHGVLPDTNAATTHALSCQAMSGLARPKQAHLYTW